MLFQKLWRDERGQDLIEYGALIGIISAAAMLAILGIGPKVAGYFENLNAILP